MLIGGARRKRQARGEQRRDDGFFDARGELRPEAEDLLEGVLREAAQTYDERKVPLLAALYSNVEYDASVPGADALLLLKRASQLTYRQFVALSVFEQHERYVDDLGQIDAMQPDTNRHPVGNPTIQIELSDLASQQLLGAASPSGGVVSLAPTLGGIGTMPSRVEYGQLRLRQAGDTLCRIAAVRELVSDEERKAWLADLRGSSV